MRDRQVLILLPPAKNLTFPATLVVTVMVVVTPLLIAPETVGALIDADSLALVMVMVTVWVSVSDPSETVTMMSYTLFAPLSKGASKSGVVTKVRTPVPETMAKSAASVPERDQERDVPASTSVAV